MRYFGKTNRLRREGRRLLARAHRLMTRRPHYFPPPERQRLTDDLSALRTALRGDDADGIERARRQCRRDFDEYLPFWRRFIVREWPQASVLSFLLAMVLRAEVVQASYVPSGSMLPTIQPGDQLIVNKFAYGLRVPFSGKKIFASSPKRGDIIVFRNPHGEGEDFVKRLIGLPGDVVQVRGDELIVNNEAVPRDHRESIAVDDGFGGRRSRELYTEHLGDKAHATLYGSGAGDHLNYNPRLAEGSACRVNDGYLTCLVPEGKYFFMGDNRDNSNDSRFWGFVPEDHLRGKALVVHFAWPPQNWKRIGTVLR